MRAPLTSLGLLALTAVAFGGGSPPTAPRASAGVADPTPHHEFYFTRGVYSGWGRGWGSRWAVDYPKADQQFLVGVQRLLDIDAYPRDHAVRLDDPDLRRFPFLYILEVGSMNLTDLEVRGLRDYLLAGGFLVVDDFWGTAEWLNFEEEMRRVLPEYRIVDLPLEHPVFHGVYQVTTVEQVPNVGNACRGGPTWERDGYQAVVRGIVDQTGHLMVVINWNTDLGDAWEWAEQACYPLRYSTYAWEVGINYIVYSMSH